MKDLKMIALGDSILKGFQGLILELNDLSATEADQMIMMTVLGDGFVTGLAVGELPLGCQPKTGQELQGSINGGVANFGIDFRDPGINLGQVLMAGRVEKDVDNLFALFGCLQPLAGNPGFKEIFLNGKVLFEIENHFHFN